MKVFKRLLSVRLVIICAGLQGFGTLINDVQRFRHTLPVGWRHPTVRPIDLSIGEPGEEEAGKSLTRAPKLNGTSPASRGGGSFDICPIECRRRSALEL